MSKVIYYDRVLDVRTRRRFYAVYSREAAEWYEKDNGKAHRIVDIEIIEVGALRVDITPKRGKK